MSNEELINVQGGVSAAVINAIIRAVNVALEIGRIIGSGIRKRFNTSKYAC